MSLISLDHVSKIYPRGTRPALDDVNLHINRGDFVFLVGASGSGKTTLLSLLLREEEATDGEIRVAGNDLRRLSNRQVPHYRRSIGFIFQDYKLLNNKTVWENVAFALEVIGTSRSTIKSMVPKVLETVGLTGKENNYPQELSGGEAQRVAIARAYVNHPQILLADEPTGNLDPTTSLGIMEVLDAINRTGTTIVMATHNEEIVNSMRKRVVELHAGRIVRDEAQGSYDSALYFPDAEVESKAHQAIESSPDMQGDSNVIKPGTAIIVEGDTRQQTAEQMVNAIADAVGNGEGDSGIARLANSVHSGRTGRYGEAFAPVEQTLTWGKGLNLEEYAEQQKAAEQAEQTAQAATEQVDKIDHADDVPDISFGDIADDSVDVVNAQVESPLAEPLSETSSLEEPQASQSQEKQPQSEPEAGETAPSAAAFDVPLPPMPPAPPAPKHNDDVQKENN